MCRSSSDSFASPALVIVISAPLPPPLGFGFMTRDSEARVRFSLGPAPGARDSDARRIVHRLAARISSPAVQRSARTHRGAGTGGRAESPLGYGHRFGWPGASNHQTGRGLEGRGAARVQAAAAAGGPDVEAGRAGGRARGGATVPTGPPGFRLPAKGHGAGSAGPSPLGVGLLPMDGRPGAACQRVELGNEGRSQQPSVLGW